MIIFLKLLGEKIRLLYLSHFNPPEPALRIGGFEERNLALASLFFTLASLARFLGMAGETTFCLAWNDKRKHPADQ